MSKEGDSHTASSYAVEFHFSDTVDDKTSHVFKGRLMEGNFIEG